MEDIIMYGFCIIIGSVAIELSEVCKSWFKKKMSDKGTVNGASIGWGLKNLHKKILFT